MKPALYVKASLFTDQPHALVIPPLFFETLPTAIGDRNGPDGLELDETKLQLLPYLNLLNEDGEVYCYYRGGSGEESRLHGNLSIGLGGHVDSEVPPYFKLEHHLKNECAREIREEVGLSVLDPIGSVSFTHLIYDVTNPVGRVHLGIRSVFVVPNKQKLQAEEGVIEKGFFRKPSEFTLDEFNRLENWSKVCLSLLIKEAKGL